VAPLGRANRAGQQFRHWWQPVGTATCLGQARALWTLKTEQRKPKASAGRLGLTGAPEPLAVQPEVLPALHRPSGGTVGRLVPQWHGAGVA